MNNIDFLNCINVPLELSELTSPQGVYNYASYVKGGNRVSYNMEQVILLDVDIALDYYRTIINGGNWHELESLLESQGSFQNIIAYITYVNGFDFTYENNLQYGNRISHNLEQSILCNPKITYNYLCNIMNGDWEDGIKALYTSTYFSLKFYKLKSIRNYDYELHISQNYSDYRSGDFIYFIEYCRVFNILPYELPVIKDCINLINTESVGDFDFNLFISICTDYIPENDLLTENILFIFLENSLSSYDLDSRLVNIICRDICNKYNIQRVKELILELYNKNLLENFRNSEVYKNDFILNILNLYSCITGFLKKEDKRFPEIEKLIMPLGREFSSKYLECLKN